MAERLCKGQEPSKRFVEEWAKITSQAIHIWKHARETNSFSQFSPYLERIVDLAKKKADLLGYHENPYDALLNNYEHGMTTPEIDPIFKNLRNDLTQLLKQISIKQKLGILF